MVLTEHLELRGTIILDERRIDAINEYMPNAIPRLRGHFFNTSPYQFLFHFRVSSKQGKIIAHF